MSRLSRTWMNASRAMLIQRARKMCDEDGKTRWVKLTSLGWRIELEPGHPDLPEDKVEPAKK